MLAIKRYGTGEVRSRSSFGDGVEVKYDTVLNHDTYSFLRVSIEVPRDQDTEALVNLNGKEIGKLILDRVGKKVGYRAFRKSDSGMIELAGSFKEMGRAVASIISDFVTNEPAVGRVPI